MPAADDQTERREDTLDSLVGVEQPRPEVRVHVIDSDQRHAERPREGLGGRDTHEQGTDQPGAVPDCDRIEIGERYAGLREGLVNDRRDPLRVSAAGEFGHHASVLGMDVVLARDHGTPDAPRVLDDGGGGLIATALDAQHQHVRSYAAPSIPPVERRIAWASGSS